MLRTSQTQSPPCTGSGQKAGPNLVCVAAAINNAQQSSLSIKRDKRLPFFPMLLQPPLHNDGCIIRASSSAKTFYHSRFICLQCDNPLDRKTDMLTCGCGRDIAGKTVHDPVFGRMGGYVGLEKREGDLDGDYSAFGKNWGDLKAEGGVDGYLVTKKGTDRDVGVV